MPSYVRVSSLFTHELYVSGLHAPRLSPSALVLTAMISLLVAGQALLGQLKLMTLSIVTALEAVFVFFTWSVPLVDRNR